MEQSERHLALACGSVGLIGCAGVIAADIAAILVCEEHNPISETISALAVGKYGWIQDLGLCLFAAGLLASAIGLFRWSLGGIGWTLAALFMVLLSVDVAVIAAVNQYAGTSNPGADIHQYGVYALGVLLVLAPLLLSCGLGRIDDAWARFSLAIGVSWAILAPIFWVVPNDWDGAYERGLALIAIAWVAALSWLLLQRGRDRPPIL